MSESLFPFLWAAVAFSALLFMQRWIHTHLHGLSLLLVGKPERAIILYALILFPGVVLHELSHWLTANLLGVRTASLSLLPRTRPDGTVQLGYVEYYKGKTLGPIRESFIGGAPLLAGTAVVLLIGFHVFGVTELAAAVAGGSVEGVTTAFTGLLATADILVWIYLIFAISNAMMPSPADRRAWPAFLLVSGVVALALYVLGLQDVVWGELAQPAAIVFGYLATAFSIAVGVDLFVMILIAGLEGLASRLRGVSVVYGRPESVE